MYTKTFITCSEVAIANILTCTKRHLKTKCMYSILKYNCILENNKTTDLGI